ncbi:aminotransferase class I/II-fold pyridoxal phosphate-dependent enzyme [Zunongwangia sp. F363]|uniref:Aminotransferase class I/II-fold pyridoxal phosphate-dependent enzyme n=1 Tax=Autumnicola tepida TaxID=3075595 RepID=A0ABU3C761_9FLAO|nr:aminotransferase class I/II-fold pyridoxal phosphate-dependent enzyme [Zunongwangia sp. F363]MDT0642185.1 aminotransferase class I/II-fold pyridoxal phosphate-dependent enzyme [Zunongwangia sp. F363]
MAKIKHNNFLDTVDEVFSDATRKGILHLNSQDTKFTGNTIKVDGNKMYHFGTTGYLGLEQDERLKKAAMEAVDSYGTQFPLSKTYISHPLYQELEEKLRTMYANPVVITKNSTLGHIAVIPTAVRDEDAVILDHQVHWSVQNAVQPLKLRGIPVEMIRHNNLDMLEDKIKELQGKVSRIWYMADGVYSMYGDFAPVRELMDLSDKYPQLHFYFDDVHGMSWKGKNGTGYVLEAMGGNLPENVLLFGTLSKTFGASGAVLACSNAELQRKIKTYGGPLTFSAQLEPASVAAACASADIHLSQEIYMLQNELSERIDYFNRLLSNTDLPLVAENPSPVFYIGTGTPVTGYNFVKRMMKEGFFVNLGLFPAVPIKNTGVRITICRHNQKEEIEKLVEAMVYHYPRALEETDSSPERVRRAFRMPVSREEKVQSSAEIFEIQCETKISAIPKEEWDSLMGKNCFEWNGQLFLEKTLTANDIPENNWFFYYILIKDKNSGVPVLATFLSYSLWKDDMLSPVSVSEKLEEQRKREPYHMTSMVLSMGSLFTEGEHLYINKTNHRWKEALLLLLQKIEELEQELKPSMVVLRDFEEQTNLNSLFHEQGFMKVKMPESCVMDNLSWDTIEEYKASLSSRSRRHFTKEVEPFEKKFDICYMEQVPPDEVSHFYQLYQNVRNNNFGLNTFAYPFKLFAEMSKDPGWEFIVLYLKPEYENRDEPKAVGVMFCYKNSSGTYVPSLVGMDYKYSREFQVYRQLLFQTIKRARYLHFEKIDFGITASFEKRKLGAIVQPKVSYVQARDNFKLELLGIMEAGIKK